MPKKPPRPVSRVRARGSHRATGLDSALKEADFGDRGVLPDGKGERDAAGASRTEVEMAVKVTTRADYKALLSRWAARTRSEPLDSWAGPGVYEGTGWMTDEWRPVCTLEKTGTLV